MAAMLLMSPLALPSQVKAQALTPFSPALPILLVVGVGNNETAEIILHSRRNQPEPQEPLLTPDKLVLMIVVTNTGDTTCRQTIGYSEPYIILPFIEETNILGVTKGSNLVSIDNGDEIIQFPLNPCFGDARVVLQVGISPKPIEPNSLPTESPRRNATILMYDIVGPDGATRATGRPLLRHPYAAILNPPSPIP